MSSMNMTEKEILTNEDRAEGKMACSLPCKETDDEAQIKALYIEMYEAMVAKDTVTLNRVHSEDFVLNHMTGLKQSKREYIKAIENGTLNYFSAEHEQINIKVNGIHATLSGRSKVNAAVFGGGRHTWRLQLLFHLVKTGHCWKFTSAFASTY